MKRATPFIREEVPQNNFTIPSASSNHELKTIFFNKTMSKGKIIIKYMDIFS
jgi:hypothetical protein